MDRARESGDPDLLALLQQPRQQIRFAVAQPQPGGHFAIAERRDVHAGDDDVGLARAADHGQVEADIAFERHSRRHVDTHADVLIGV